MRLRGWLMSVLLASVAACGGAVVPSPDGDAGPDGDRDVVPPPDIVGDTSGGCVINGTWVPFGASEPEGCNICYCETSGVSCTGVFCPDGGGPDIEPPPGCYTPDGTLIPEGGTYFNGCALCTCVAGMLSCPPCIDAGPPPDAGFGCSVPWGGTIPPGAVVTEGCLTCMCEGAARAVCWPASGCVDAGPPPDTGTFCVTPDGSSIPPGATYTSGCTVCTCRPDGSLYCSTSGCTDGGTACNTLDPTSFPPPATLRSSGGPPPALGGPPPLGRYYLATIISYGGPSIPLDGMLIDVTGATMQYASDTAGMISNGTAGLSTSGPEMILSVFCPSPSAPSPLGYTTAPGMLTWYIGPAGSTAYGLVFQQY